MLRRNALLLGVAAALLGSGGLAHATEALRVFAAASLTEAFREAAAAFEATRPGVGVELNFAGSQVLRTQIEQGAPADVFASADLLHAEALRVPGLLRPYRVFARNKLLVVVPATGARVKGLADLARPGITLVVAGDGVPAGRYTGQVIARLAASGRYGAGFEPRVRANVASQETNVRAVLAKVALGEADAGFVYLTDAAGSDRVRTIGIPDPDNVIAEYPIGVLANSAQPAAAQAFVDLVVGDVGQAILRKHGFAP
jgi:molybdate transport system substrate-binding protein